jgi:cytochrome c553
MSSAAGAFARWISPFLAVAAVAGLVCSTVPVEVGRSPAVRLASNGNPLAGQNFYVNPDSKAMRAARGAGSPQLDAIANTATAYWMDQASSPAVDAKYIAAALGEYKKGERKHPTMRAIAASLNDQDVADLAAFYENENKSAAPVDAAAATPSGNVAELLKKGNCVSCHGDNFSKPIDPSYPKLAGQHGDYLFYALKAYQTDKNPQVGRGNPVMKGMVAQFTHAELKEIASYLATLPTQLATVPQSRFR